MARGRLRVMLGAAPGVGKTFAMLEEGERLRRQGTDVVVALVETHGRTATAALLDGFELIPRRTVEHRGVTLTELDLDAVLQRAPALALVDELAHTNAPGSEHEKRWQDVDALLDAGIDVISTVNIQHIESLNDVVEQITGVPQRETIPDAVLRRADRIELVDLAPQALRDRLAEGVVYPAGRVDAALSNYFRLGNLTALRELALLWLADEVDNALQQYRAEHGIAGTWEARERVVVALTGGPEGETLLRRGARIAARSAGGDLLAVHVTSQDGLRDAAPGILARQRALAEQLGGSYHQVVGDDIPRALVEFARGESATQLVIGVSRRSRLSALLTGPGIGATVIRESGDIDVHIVSHARAGGRFSLPRPKGGLTVRRRVYGFLLALVGGPLLTLLLTSSRSPESMTADVLSYQLLVVVVALVGGIWPALFAALLSGLTLDFFFVDPLYTITVGEPLHLLALILYVIIAALVSLVVDQAARRTRSAQRAAAEAELLATVAGGVIRGEDAVQALVERTREAFGLTSVELVTTGPDGGREVIASDVGTAEETGAAATAAPPASPSTAEPELTIPLTVRGAEANAAARSRTVLELRGRDLEAGDRRLLSAIVAQLEAAIEHRALTATAAELAPLAEADRVRSALLAAVGHDLRRPLAAATAAVTTLRQEDLALDEDDREALLETAEDSLRGLASLVTDLLDASRVQAGVLGVSLTPTELDDVVLPALDELGVGPGDVELDLSPDLPPLRADAVLLQRVLVNLLGNALRYSPAGTPPVLAASAFAGTVQLRVVDRGPGIPPERREAVFAPFQRLSDTDNDAGIGLGLALSKGFVEGMGGTLEAEDTPGGGLTMVVSLPAAEGTAP
ncbi:ATP-binding protein [Leifsonia sp. C5G2]|uniref:ATP-binding protein n=1 Tax=Leifsonia sp. C5G2 TaxID=2735269 RepID=UPI00158487E4|nr:ATP-binding protein [Leifsonia sp. C5G2]NUU08535.1 sensor histidine kinase KdpD [Leifsonia sp. C5G2]